MLVCEIFSLFVATSSVQFNWRKHLTAAVRPGVRANFGTTPRNGKAKKERVEEGGDRNALQVGGLAIVMVGV
jgi:hypothetical protein